jgi:ferric-dicitrate binding protein FerR (iron transport regulator)
VSGDQPKGRWLGQATGEGQRALRQALDEAAPGQGESELAKYRVWSRVQSPWGGGASERSRPWAWFAAMALGVGLGAAVLVAIAQYRQSGRVVVATAPTHLPVTAAAPAPAAGSVALTTGPGRAHHRLPRGVEVELSPRTALVPGDDQTAPEVTVGRVRFTVPHQDPGRRYTVRAGPYQVWVVGTVFEVSVEEEGVGVSVDSGVVQVEDAVTGQRLQRLEAGQRWSSATEAARPPAATRTALVTAPPRRLTIEPTDPAVKRVLDEARAARRGGDPRRALALYEQLASGGGPLAESALYEIGDIAIADLHDPRQAYAAWDRYRERYPKGQLRVEADISVIEVLTQMGEQQQALDEALAFLRRHPDSERRGEVARVAGDLSRTRGDCLAAIGLYDTALRGHLAPSDADDATFHRASCLTALHDPRAAEAARAYLSRYPTPRHAAEAHRLLGKP